MLAKKQIELSGVMLHMAHAVEHRLAKGEIERAELTDAARLVLGEIGQNGTAFFAAVAQIGCQLRLGPGPLREKARGIQFAQVEGRRWSKPHSRTGELQIEKEEGVISQIPKPDDPVVVPCGRLGRIAPEIVGTGVHGVIEHVDGSPELVPRNFVPGRLQYAPSSIGPI